MAHADSHSEGPISIQEWSVWELWWVKWHWDDRVLSEHSGFPPVSIIPPLLHTHLFTSLRRYLTAPTDSSVKSCTANTHLLDRTHCFVTRIRTRKTELPSNALFMRLKRRRETSFEIKSGTLLWATLHFPT
jgi:hypothetical protein